MQTIKAVLYIIYTVSNCITLSQKLYIIFAIKITSVTLFRFFVHNMKTNRTKL